MPNSIADVIVKKLQQGNDLDADDIDAIHSLPLRRKQLGAREAIVSYGDRPDDCCVILDGFATRSLTLLEGERQILSVHIPGEIPDIQTLHVGVLDHDLRTLSPCSIALISHAALRTITHQRPNVAAAFWRESLLDAAIYRQWIVNVGRRDAIGRMAHLIAETYFRLEAIGRADGSFKLPMTQVDLADCAGLSAVHTNRVLQDLRRQRVIELHRDTFSVLDLHSLKLIAQFDPLYLRSPR